MKNSAFPLFSAFLILLVACNRIDNAFVEQIQTGLNKAQENKTAFEAGLQQSVDLFDKLSKAPDGLKKNPKFGFMDVYTRVAQMQQILGSMIVAQDEMVAKAQKLLDDYTDGNVKKDSIITEITGILANIDGYQSRIERMNSMIEEADKGFDQVTAAWNAAPESEKTASAAMPAPVMPDWLAGLAGRKPGYSTAPNAATGGTPQTAPIGTAPPAPGQTGTTPSTTKSSDILTAPKQDGQKQ